MRREEDQVSSIAGSMPVRRRGDKEDERRKQAKIR
jgi:hypothetical protein